MLQINTGKKCRNLFWFILIAFTLFNIKSMHAQTDFLSSQYMNSQLIINPAYAGLRNSFSVNTLVRQQWMGVNGAPASYLISVHSPLNNRMASVGAGFIRNETGPVQSNELSAIYSYLVRLGNRMFISFGLNARLYHYNIGLTSLDVIDEGDQSFYTDTRSEFKPNFGAGTFLFTSNFYLGISMPQILNNQIKSGESDFTAFNQIRTFYLTSGYKFPLSKEFSLKPSFLARLRQNANSLVDVNMQLIYNDLFWIGSSYRLGTAMAFLAR